MASRFGARITTRQLAVICPSDAWRATGSRAAGNAIRISLGSLVAERREPRWIFDSLPTAALRETERCRHRGRRCFQLRKHPGEQPFPPVPRAPAHAAARHRARETARKPGRQALEAEAG